ncbi:MAG: lysophospholipid acyltransferase family protein, partial [Candidatus Aminicenantes bacterium]|nr:lysophospholipid acyltransferase family protein [Candidatus Aminicenantes bacterium]
MKFRRKIKYFFTGKAAKLLINSILFTCRIRIRGEEAVKELRAKKTPIIYVYWHRHIFFTIYKFKNSGARPLISLSPDGELVSRIGEEFGLNPVRGSSSKGGARAFLKLVNTIKGSAPPENTDSQKKDIIKSFCGGAGGSFFKKRPLLAEGRDSTEILITADGPKGPLKEIKDGTVFLAQKTGAVIVPFCWYSSRVKVLEKTWDRFIVPLPFGRVTFVYGAPFVVPRDTKKAELPGIKQKIKAELDRLENELEEGAGHPASGGPAG